MNTMTYKGYAAKVDFDAEDEVFTGRIAGIRDVVGFHADTVADLKAAFHEAVDDYVETCKKVGKKPQKPYSGNIMLRVDPNVHSRVAIAAELAGKSLNEWGEAVLDRAAAVEVVTLAKAAQSSGSPLFGFAEGDMAAWHKQLREGSRLFVPLPSRRDEELQNILVEMLTVEQPLVTSAVSAKSAPSKKPRPARERRSSAA